MDYPLEKGEGDSQIRSIVGSGPANRKQTSREVLRTLAKLMLRYGVPKHIRSDNGPEFVARAVRSWLARLDVQTLFIEPGSPWENGDISSFEAALQAPSTSQRFSISAPLMNGYVEYRPKLYLRFL